MEKFRDTYRIPSARAQWHDYNDGMYFITICTAGQIHYFGKIIKENMLLNALGECVLENIDGVATHYPYAEITISQIMPNHLHLIVIIDETKILRDTNVQTGRAVAVKTGRAPSLQQSLNEKMKTISDKKGLLSVCMGGIKSAVTHYAHDKGMDFAWQTRFHDHIIRDKDEYVRIANYIGNNPRNWLADKFHPNKTRPED